MDCLKGLTVPKGWTALDIQSEAAYKHTYMHQPVCWPAHTQEGHEDTTHTKVRRTRHDGKVLRGSCCAHHN